MNQPPDGTEETVDILRQRIRSLEHFLRTIRTDIFVGLHELEERQKSEDSTALAEEFGASAIAYLRSLQDSIATYIGHEVLMKG